MFADQVHTHLHELCELTQQPTNNCRVFTFIDQVALYSDVCIHYSLSQRQSLQCKVWTCFCCMRVHKSLTASGGLQSEMLQWHAVLGHVDMPLSAQYLLSCSYACREVGPHHTKCHVHWASTVSHNINQISGHVTQCVQAYVEMHIVAKFRS